MKSEAMSLFDREITAALELEDTARLDILITRTTTDGETFDHQISIYESEESLSE